MVVGKDSPTGTANGTISAVTLGILRVADHTLRAIAKRYAVREEESTHLVWQLVGIGGKIIGDSRTLP